MLRQPSVVCTSGSGAFEIRGRRLDGLDAVALTVAMVNVQGVVRMDDSSAPQLPVMSLISRSAISTFLPVALALFVDGQRDRRARARRASAMNGKRSDSGPSPSPPKVDRATATQMPPAAISVEHDRQRREDVASRLASTFMSATPSRPTREIHTGPAGGRRRGSGRLAISGTSSAIIASRKPAEPLAFVRSRSPEPGERDCGVQRRHRRHVADLSLGTLDVATAARHFADMGRGWCHPAADQRANSAMGPAPRPIRRAATDIPAPLALAPAAGWASPTPGCGRAAGSAGAQTISAGPVAQFRRSCPHRAARRHQLTPRSRMNLPVNLDGDVGKHRNDAARPACRPPRLTPPPSAFWHQGWRRLRRPACPARPRWRRGSPPGVFGVARVGSAVPTST